MTEWLHDFRMNFFACYLEQRISCPPLSAWVELSAHRIRGTNAVHACMGENGRCVTAICVHQNKQWKVRSQEPYRVKTWPPKRSKLSSREYIYVRHVLCSGGDRIPVYAEINGVSTQKMVVHTSSVTQKGAGAETSPGILMWPENQSDLGTEHGISVSDSTRAMVECYFRLHVLNVD